MITSNPVIYGEYQRIFNSLKPSVSDAVEDERVRKIAISQISSILGSRVESIAVGGASSSEEVLQFMRETWGSKVSEGYGSTGFSFFC